MFTAEGHWQRTNTRARVTGVGMFDLAHGQTGAAPNDMELHPVLDIIFNPAADRRPAPARKSG